MNRKFTFLAVIVTSIMAAVYNFVLLNILINFFRFIFGYDYDLLGVLIGTLWLSSVAWVFIYPKLSTSMTVEPSMTTSSLHKISHIRTNVLQPLSAQEWNHQSQAAISFFTGVDTNQYLTAPTDCKAHDLKPAEISITGQFTSHPAAAASKSTDEGEKKASTPVTAPKSDSTNSSSDASTPADFNSVIQPKPYVVINTSIPVPSLASAEVQAVFEAKLLANKARQARKTQPVSNQS